MVAGYTYTVVWSQEDQAYVGRVIEFPSLGAHGATAQEALAEIMRVVEMVLEDMASTGEVPPPPQGA